MRLYQGFGFILCLFLVACTFQKAPLGSKDNPIKIYFSPSIDAKVIEDNAQAFKDFLEKNTAYRFQVSSPQSFIAVVEAFGTQRADVAGINTYGYILARKKYGVEARATFIRYGRSTYQAQILARVDGPIHKISDFKGKKFAFVDPASASGYILPKKLFRDLNINLKDEVFAMKHDSVVSMIYQRQVDGGATYYSPPEKGQIQDARSLVKTQYPDVENKIKIIQLTDSIPNDPLIFRRDLPEDLKKSILEALIQFVKTEAGRKAFEAIFGATDLQLATDLDYDSSVKMFEALNVDPEKMEPQK